jgi:hypothetical protein
LIVTEAPSFLATASGASRRQGNHPYAAPRQHAHIFQSDRPATNDRSGITGTNFHLVDAPQHASQRLHKSRAMVVNGVRDFQHVLAHNSSRYAHVLRVRAVVEQQIVAKILLAAPAVVTPETRRRIRGNHPRTEAPLRVHTLAHGHDFAHHLMAKYRGRLDHHRVVTTLPHLQVGSVSQRQAHAQQHFVHRNRGHVDLLHTQIFAAVQDRRRHL